MDQIRKSHCLSIWLTWVGILICSLMVFFLATGQKGFTARDGPLDFHMAAGIRVASGSRYAASQERACRGLGAPFIAVLHCFFLGGNFRYICLDVWTGLSSCMFFKDRDGIRMTPLVNFQRSKYAFATLRTIAPVM